MAVNEDGSEVSIMTRRGDVRRIPTTDITDAKMWSLSQESSVEN